MRPSIRELVITIIKSFHFNFYMKLFIFNLCFMIFRVKYDVLKTLSKVTEKVVIYYMLLIGSYKVIYSYLKRCLPFFFPLWPRARNIFLHSNQLPMCTQIMGIHNSETNLPILYFLPFPIKNEKCCLAHLHQFHNPLLERKPAVWNSLT